MSGLFCLFLLIDGRAFYHVLGLQEPGKLQTEGEKC